jgi:hypothetical protein
MIKRLVAVLLITGCLVGIIALTGCDESEPYQQSYHQPITWQLSTMVVEGQGNISPGSASLDNGDVITLTAYPASGWEFDHWGSQASGTQNPITITMDSDKTIYAYFSEASVSAPTQQRYLVNLVTPDQILESAGYTYHPYTIQAGKTINISWSADGDVNVYIFTETRFGNWVGNSATGDGNYVAARTYSSSGTLFYTVADTDTYYLVIKNPSGDQDVKVYSATASW